MKTYLKENRSLFILPLALLPFVILIFYILGGGEQVGKDKKKQNSHSIAGANYSLPEADRSIGIYDKMDAYRREDTRGITKNYRIAVKEEGEQGLATDTTARKDTDEIKAPVLSEDPVELLAHIQEQGNQVRKNLEKERAVPDTAGKGIRSVQKRTIPKISAVKESKGAQSVGREAPATGVEELDRILLENSSLGYRNDSLAFQLVQARQRIERLEAKSRKRLTVIRMNAGKNVDDSVLQIPIRAEVYETTTVLDGNRVKLRLLEGCTVHKCHVKANTFLYGNCQVRNERLFIRIIQFPFDGGFLPVDMVVCDLDGMEGLYVPDNAARKVTKEVGASTNTSSLFGMTSDPLTYTGIRAADRATRALLQRVRLKRVTVKKNTLVYLINQNGTL